MNPIVAEIGRSMITPIKPGAGSEKVRHSREGGNPETFVIEMDSRLRGNDGDACLRPRPGERAAPKVALIFKETR